MSEDSDRKHYEVKLIDGAIAHIVFEQCEKIVPIVVINAVGYEMQKRVVWSYTITIADKTLFCTSKDFRIEFRHALKRAYERLAEDEGVLPGAVPVEVRL